MNENIVKIIPIIGLPEFKKNDNLIQILDIAFGDIKEKFMENDVLVITQKIISKIEDRAIDLEVNDISEVLKNESTEILRKRGETVIARTKHGFICANAGIDKSNIDKGYALLLPEDPDKTARALRHKISAEYGVNIAVIISDTFGRAWRKGQTNVAIGCSGIEPLSSYIGTTDSFGNDLMATEIAIIDELAAASELVMNKVDDVPVAIIRGYSYNFSEKGVNEIIRDADEDFFL
ncbi:coenzyme F420-0:L-glutamate ligase [Candidatus Actinomarina sp.]|jgi:coenzyme F420-0:L-glutamate ligase/coenzyme F420-1:gamma-L-glutamate ligase|nr:coenzyme F420-0:L-glutamate ligase [Candidatus Actinomarina sp.]MDA9036763.1 coenzyme F420-0:L-glutamate ligase [Acidimicrobiia bacterium]MDA8709946.1 coenzyme F420-0:L-glutamate ligase [Candidatus Actinomarina sp.]MDA8719485.1 coenzyme F420-0:L-glutamate ligase [Candidatus Actinomarina sp.]MDA9845823.1 coenzyme F420-0:L-glutamate ligase [Acidimicrobiia bacterium]